MNFGNYVKTGLLMAAIVALFGAVGAALGGAQHAGQGAFGAAQGQIKLVALHGAPRWHGDGGRASSGRCCGWAGPAACRHTASNARRSFKWPPRASPKVGWQSCSR